MKNYIIAIIAAVFLLATVLSGCTTEVKAYTESGQVINTSADKEFQIALGSNPTTGYSWHATFDEQALKQVNNDYKADDTTGKQIVGAGGTEYFTFKALKTGDYKITFTYYRPWETPTAQDKTQEFTIKVK